MTVATTERTRLETLQEQEVKLAEQVEQLREKIATYPDRIAKERESAWYAKPSKRPLAQLNSPLQKLLDAEKGDVATLNGLQQDLSAVRNVIQQEDVRVREQEIAEARAALEVLHVKEEGIWKRAGEAFAEMASVWMPWLQSSRKSRSSQPRTVSTAPSLRWSRCPQPSGRSCCCYTRRLQIQPCTQLLMCRS
jgi:chaperonin cofactor prefoldin